MWQYQLSIAFTFLDVIGASSPLVNITSRLFIVISLALKYYDDDGGGATRTTRGGMLHSATVRTVTPPGGLMNTVRDILYSTTVRTLNSIWMIFAWVAKKFIYLIAYNMSILLIYLFIMAIQSIDYKAAVYHSVTCLIWLPISIVWRFLGRLADALLGCIVYLYTKISLVLAPFDQVEQKEPLPPPPAIAVSDDEDSDDDDSTIYFGAAADPIDDFDCVMPPPPPPKRRARRRRKVYPPAVWHRGRGGRGGRLRPRAQPG